MKWYENHLPTCGTKFRGCDPSCPKEVREQAHLEAVEKLRVGDLSLEGYARAIGRPIPTRSRWFLIGSLTACAIFVVTRLFL